MVAMAITPGPNTIMSMANASEKGLRRGIYLNYGMFVGILIVDILTYLIISLLIKIIPSLLLVFKSLGIIYLIYLAIHILLSKEGNITPGGGSFVTGVVMQFANVKVMLLCFSAQTMYIINSEYELFLLLLIPIVCFLSGLVWAVAGSIISQFYKKRRVLMNVIFSSSLFILAMLNVYQLLKEILSKY